MRRRAVQMTLVAVAVAVLLLGLPLAIFGALMIWDSEQSTLDLRAISLSRTVERRLSNGEQLDESMLEPFVGGVSNLPASIQVQGPDGREYTAGPQMTGNVMRSLQLTPSSATVRMEVDASAVTWRATQVVLLVILATVIAFVGAAIVALRQSRSLSAPLIY
ncbi:sensor histidine kinase, partial [Georgenia sp. 10Sc9-8]|nr:sensor histidine kinase [Georgenia halotolerans]